MNGMIFKRKIYQQMLKWKLDMDGKSALLIKGARRVGKSTIVEEFAKNEYESYVIVDFSNAAKEVHELFRDISDLDYFFLRLQLLYRVDLYHRKSVIIFDEVQIQPLARQAIKHLVKDHRYDYIEIGSLLSIKKNILDIIIPSEETRITMFPMDYEEFCWALDDTTSADLIKIAFDKKKPLGDDVNRRLMRDFRLYMLVGGMPQAVNKYISSNNFRMVDQVKRDILELYEDDFRRIDASGRASLLFRGIPSQLSKNSSRYQVSSVDANSRLSRVEEIIANMLDSMTVNISYHADDPNIGMALNINPDFFKLFIADTGLFITQIFKDKDFTENIIYEKLLSNKLPTNLGYVYENMVAQILKASGHELFYYTIYNPSTKRNYEVDFLLTNRHKICPIEVKSSGYGTHKSLDIFCQKYSTRVSDKYLVYTKDLKIKEDILMIPIYMLPFI